MIPSRAITEYDPSINEREVHALQKLFDKNMTLLLYRPAAFALLKFFVRAYGQSIVRSCLRYALVTLAFSYGMDRSEADAGYYYGRTLRSLQRRLNDPSTIDEGDLFTAFLLSLTNVIPSARFVHVLGTCSIMKHLVTQASNYSSKYRHIDLWPFLRDELIFVVVGTAPVRTAAECCDRFGKILGPTRRQKEEYAKLLMIPWKILRRTRLNSLDLSEYLYKLFKHYLEEIIHQRRQGFRIHNCRQAVQWLVLEARDEFTQDPNERLEYEVLDHLEFSLSDDENIRWFGFTAATNTLTNLVSFHLKRFFVTVLAEKSLCLGLCSERELVHASFISLFELFKSYSTLKSSISGDISGSRSPFIHTYVQFWQHSAKRRTRFFSAS